jgi:hypothetical protein
VVGSRAGAVETEVTIAKLRAGSSLRLKGGSVQDDVTSKKQNCTTTLDLLHARSLPPPGLFCDEARLRSG